MGYKKIAGQIDRLCALVSSRLRETFSSFLLSEATGLQSFSHALYFISHYTCKCEIIIPCSLGEACMHWGVMAGCRPRRVLSVTARHLRSPEMLRSIRLALWSLHLLSLKSLLPFAKSLSIGGHTKFSKYFDVGAKGSQFFSCCSICLAFSCALKALSLMSLPPRSIFTGNAETSHKSEGAQGL